MKTKGMEEEKGESVCVDFNLDGTAKHFAVLQCEHHLSSQVVQSIEHIQNPHFIKFFISFYHLYLTQSHRRPSHSHLCPNLSAMKYFRQHKWYQVSAFALPFSPSSTLPTRLKLHPIIPRWTCSSNRRRKHIGVPKNVQIEPPPRQLTADESPWEDYLIPELAGNSKPRDPSLYLPTILPNSQPTSFLVLGVESSCDDTAAAIVRSDGTILGESRVSQQALTEQWGGVVPHVAREAHESAIEQVIDSALSTAGVKRTDLSAVAATMGPGLEVCLRVGYRAARKVANEINADFVAVNHLEAHVLVTRLAGDIKFPFLTLLVSGGHCQLLLARAVGQYDLLGGTLDDAAGEAFDKTARILGLAVGTGGGQALEKIAKQGNSKAIPFPVPMAKRNDCNFSFAGLKTSVRVAMNKLGGEEKVRKDGKLTADVAASFQETAVKHMEQRLRKAIKVCAAFEIDVDTLVIAGGVAANQTVRSRLKQVCEDAEWRFVVPDSRLCVDNGVMVAWTGVERLRLGIADDTRNLDVRARWPLAALGRMSGPLPNDVN